MGSEPRLPLAMVGRCHLQGHEQPRGHSPGLLGPDTHHTGPRCCSGVMAGTSGPDTQIPASRGPLTASPSAR